MLYKGFALKWKMY